MSDPAHQPATTDPRISRLGLDVLTQLAATPPLQPRAQAFVFLRHGATDGNVNKIFQRFDQELNAIGLEQANAAARALKARGGIARILASDMPRAWKTANIVGDAIGLKPTVEVRLRERWFGDWVGTPSATLDWAKDPPNGDTLKDFIARTREGFTAALDSDVSTLVVAHGGNLYVLAAALGVTLEVDHMHNATPLAFRRDGAAWRLEAIGPAVDGLYAPS